MLPALHRRLFLFAGGQNGHAFADHAALTAQGAQFAGRAALATIEDDHFVFDLRGLARPVENVAEANPVLGALVILRDQHAFVGVGVEAAVAGEIQQRDIAVPGKQFADLVFELFPAQVVLGGGQHDVLEVRIAIGVSLQHGSHGHGVIAAAAQPRNVGVVVDADKQSLAHGYTAVCWRIALMMLLVFHAHSACAASRTTVEMRSAPNGLIAMITLPMRLAISISLLIHLL
ncbi:hypothetical protein D3C72_640280 [compost metagenome]